MIHNRFNNEYKGLSKLEKRLFPIPNFKIINQTNVASGIRRIEALTNIAVDKYNKQKIYIHFCYWKINGHIFFIIFYLLIIQIKIFLFN